MIHGSYPLTDKIILLTFTGTLSTVCELQTFSFALRQFSK